MVAAATCAFLALRILISERFPKRPSYYSSAICRAFRKKYGEPRGLAVEALARNGHQGGGQLASINLGQCEQTSDKERLLRDDGSYSSNVLRTTTTLPGF